MANLSSRKIQKLGSSSLVVTIPKNWALRLGLTSGDRVAVIDEGDHLKIMPYDLLNSDNKRAIRLPLKKILENDDVLNSIIRCLYLCGIERIQFSRHLKNDTIVNDLVKKIEEGLGCSAAKEVKVLKDYIEVKLKCEAKDPRYSIKVLNSEVHELMSDIAFGILGDESRKVKAVEEVRRVKRLIETVARSFTNFLSRIGAETSNCGVLSLLANLRFIGDLLEVLVNTVQEISDPRAVGYVSALRAALSDALGGLAAGSFRRVVRSKTLSEKIRLIIEGTKDGRNIFYGVLLSLALAIRSLATETLCLLFISSSNED